MAVVFVILIIFLFITRVLCRQRCLKYSARNITSHIIIRPEILAEYILGHKRVIRIMTNVNHAENEEQSDDDDFMDLDHLRNDCNFELTDVHFNDRKTVLINDFVNNAESMWSPPTQKTAIEHKSLRFF